MPPGATAVCSALPPHRGGDVATLSTIPVKVSIGKPRSRRRWPAAAAGAPAGPISEVQQAITVDRVGTVTVGQRETLFDQARVEIVP